MTNSVILKMDLKNHISLFPNSLYVIIPDCILDSNNRPVANAKIILKKPERLNSRRRNHNILFQTATGITKKYRGTIRGQFSDDSSLKEREILKSLKNLCKNQKFHISTHTQSKNA